MKSFSLALVFFLVAAATSMSAAEPETSVAAGANPIAIPLDQIWAWDMPGTKDVRQLEGQGKFKGMGFTDRVQNSLATNTHWRLNHVFVLKGNKRVRIAGSAFVVDAVDLAALKKANAIFAKEQEPRDSFKASRALTLVFYASGSSRSVRIKEVLKGKNEIVVKYHFHVHGHRTTSKYYALVPLGNDLSGRIKVTIERTEDTIEDYLAKSNSPIPELSRNSDAKRSVSGSTLFTVLPPPE